MLSNFNNEGEWFDAIVLRVFDGGLTVEIQYVDDEDVEKVPATLIKHKPRQKPRKQKTVESTDNAARAIPESKLLV